MFGNLKSSLFYLHTNAENNKHQTKFILKSRGHKTFAQYCTLENIFSMQFLDKMLKN